MTTVELIKSIAFDFGWTVSTDEEEDTVVFDFRYYTKHGLDYGFCAELTGNNFDGFLGEVERNCEDFDPDYEAYRWIGYDGHGKCGAPYHSRFPNFHKSGSIAGMKRLYYGKNALLVRCGRWIYNVSSEPEIYYNLAH